MFARVTVVQGSADKVEQGIESFKTRVLATVKTAPGYKGALLLGDRQTGKGMGITLWESEDASRKGGEAVASAREATIQAMGGSVPPVEEFEVLVSDL